MSELLDELRVEAINAQHQANRYTKWAEALTAAAGHIEAQDKRFAEHLDAWKANNVHRAQRIAELEKSNINLMAQWHAERNQLRNKPPCICSACETVRST